MKFYFIPFSSINGLPHYVQHLVQGNTLKTFSFQMKFYLRQSESNIFPGSTVLSRQISVMKKSPWWLKPLYHKGDPKRRHNLAWKRRKCANSFICRLHFLLLVVFCLTVLSHWDFSMGNLGCFPWGKPAATESRYPIYGACWVFLCFHNPSNSDMDYWICHMHSDITAWDCT